MSLKITIGQNIVKERLKQHLTQQKLAEICGISASTLRNIEHGTANTSITILEDIAEKLKIPACQLFLESTEISSVEQIGEAVLENQPSATL